LLSIFTRVGIRFGDPQDFLLNPTVVGEASGSSIPPFIGEANGSFVSTLAGKTSVVVPTSGSNTSHTIGRQHEATPKRKLTPTQLQEKYQRALQEIAILNVIIPYCGKINLSRMKN